MTNFKDTGANTKTFINESPILYACEECGGLLRLNNLKTRAVCSECSFSTTKTDNLPYFLKIKCCGEILWAVVSCVILEAKSIF
jgi:hypothetical protein